MRERSPRWKSARSRSRRSSRPRSRGRPRSRSRSRSQVPPQNSEQKRLSEGATPAAKAVREELARRWVDVNSGRLANPSARILQQSIQMRANMMTRRALQRTAATPKPKPNVAAADANANENGFADGAGAVGSGAGGATIGHQFASQGFASAAGNVMNMGPLPVGLISSGGPLPVGMITNSGGRSTLPRGVRALLGLTGSSQGFLRFWDALDVRNEDSTSRVTRVVQPLTERPSDSSTVDCEEAARQVRLALEQLPVQTLMEPAKDQCAICMDKMETGEDVRRLACAHMFHAACITKWLHIRPTCPLDNLPIDQVMATAACQSHSHENAASTTLLLIS